MASVLVVDDEVDIRQAMAEVLEDEGYEVHAAANGAEGLRQLREHRPALVLLDLMMPVMNGWEFRRAQLHDPELADVPVVVLSAVGRAPALEVDAFLQKPFDLETLLAQVRQFVHAREERDDGPRPAAASEHAGSLGA